MATTVVLTEIVKEPAPSTRCLARFADGAELEFSSLSDLQAQAREPDTSRRLTQLLCLSYLLARSSELTNITSVANKNFTFDLSVAQPIRVQ